MHEEYFSCPGAQRVETRQYILEAFSGSQQLRLHGLVVGDVHQFGNSRRNLAPRAAPVLIDGEVRGGTNQESGGVRDSFAMRIFGEANECAVQQIFGIVRAMQDAAHGPQHVEPPLSSLQKRARAICDVSAHFMNPLEHFA